MSDRAASACDREGATTYELGPSLGSITPTSVTLSKDQQPARSIVLEFDESDAETLGKVSQQAVDKQLAILFEGRVLSAPLVREPITDGRFMMAFGSSSQAQKITKALKATTPSGP
jgi:preprotein translocase subunit SecD